MAKTLDYAPAVSITIVAYNSANCLRECLDSIYIDIIRGIAEAFVVDNKSPDESAQIVLQEYSEITLIKSDQNRMFAGGCNLSWSQVRGRYWLLLNPDAVLPLGSLQKLVEWMDQNPEIGAASPELVDRLGRQQCAGRRFMTVSRLLLEITRLHLLLSAKQRSDIFLGSYWKGEEHLDVDWVPGAALIVRRDAVEQAGLLSEQVLMYGEDSEWCWRIRKAGWKIGVCGRVQVMHEEGQSTVLTWGNQERDKRMWRGTYDAIRFMRGRLYAVTIMFLNTLAFALESCHPKRGKGHRKTARQLLKTHFTLLKTSV